MLEHGALLHPNTDYLAERFDPMRFVAWTGATISSRIARGLFSTLDSGHTVLGEWVFCPRRSSMAW